VRAFVQILSGVGRVDDRTCENATSARGLRRYEPRKRGLIWLPKSRTYQIHWRVRDARLRRQPTPPGKLPRMPVEDCEPPVEVYDAGVVQERHHALNSLIGYCGQDWDDITTDT
jgi:hypothetical protein